MGVILLLIGYYKEPIASGSSYKTLEVLMKSDKKFEKLHSQKLDDNLDRRTEIQTEPNLRHSLAVDTKRNKYPFCWDFTCQQS